MITHEVRLSIAELLSAIRASHEFSPQGCCLDVGKYEGCYEATIYFHQIGLDGDHGEGLLSYHDGSSLCAYRVSPEERAMMAGPWDHPGHVMHWDNMLYAIQETGDGFLIGTHCTDERWAELTEEATEGDDESAALA